MSSFINFKYKENLFLIIFISSFIFSILNSFYQIKQFDNYKEVSSGPNYHSMIRGDIEDFYSEGDSIASDIREGKSYFETGGEYRRPYLPSRIFALYSLIFDEDLYDQENNVSSNNSKIYLLIIQSLLYFSLLFFLYKKILNLFSKPISQLTILFLSLEPTIFMYHSSFWSESIFFSIQIFIIIFFLKRKFNYFELFIFGLIIGLFYLQRSVAIFYIAPVLLVFYFINKKKIFKTSLFVLLGYILVHLFVGYHNYVRIGLFYTTSTQAKDGFYIYLAPNILSTKLNISPKKVTQILDNEKYNWAKSKNLDLNKEHDRLKFYAYQKNKAINIIFQNPLNSIKVIAKKTLHFVIIDPLTHVFYFHKWNQDDGYFYKSNDHQKWIKHRIIYSIIIYFICFFGVFEFYRNKNNKNFLFFLLLSILYFTVVQSWYGGTRYFAPILIYLSFLFSHGLIFLIKKFKNYNLINVNHD